MSDVTSNSRQSSFTGSSPGDRKHEKRLIVAVIGDSPLKSRWARLAWGGQNQKKSVIEDTEYKLYYFSNLGVEKSFGIFDSVSRTAALFTFVYDVTNRASFLAFEVWRNWIYKTRGVTGDQIEVPVLILGIVPTHRAVKNASTLPSTPMPSTAPPPLPAGAAPSPSPSPAPASAPAPAPYSPLVSQSTRDMIRQPSAARMSKFIMSPLKLPNAKREESPYTFPSEVFGSKAGEEIMPGVVRAVAADEARRVAAAYGASFREVRLDAPEETLLAPILRMLKTIVKNAEIEEMRSPSSTGDGVTPRVSEIIQHTRGSRLSVALGEPGFVFDVTLCGDGFVGKSSLIAALMNRSNQPPSHKYVETPDVILHKYSFEVDDLQVQLRIRDINGVLATEQLTRDNILDTQCILFIYDVYSRDSFNRLQELRAHIETCKQDKRWAIVLVANKVDGRDAVLFSRPVVSPEEGRALAQSWNCPYVETSARDDSASELFRMAIREVRHVYGMTSSETVSTDAHGYVNLKVKNKFKKYYAALHHGMFSWRSKDTDKKPKAAVEITHDSSVSHNGMSDKAGYVLTLTVRGDNNAKQVIQLGTQSALELEQWSMALNAEIGVRRVFRNMLADQMRPIFREILQDSPYSLGSLSPPLSARSSSPLGGSDHISATKAASTLALTNASKRKSNLIAPADLDKVLRKKKIDAGHL